MTDLRTTRESLHAVAELLLAGPQFELSRTIRLRPTPGGFATTRAPDVRVSGRTLVVGDRSVDLHGRTVAEVARDAGIVARSLDDVFADGCGLGPEHRLDVDAAALAQIAAAFEAGAAALAVFAPEEASTLWPEHFDVALTLDAVNYGVSPGDGYLPEPYAYVGPPSSEDLRGAFWNAPFGAAQALGALDDLVAFFHEGRQVVDHG